jgi:hypothetical protein
MWLWKLKSVTFGDGTEPNIRRHIEILFQLLQLLNLALRFGDDGLIFGGRHLSQCCVVK